MVSTPCLSSSAWLTAPTKPSSCSTSATRRLSLDEGKSTFALRAVIALRMRVSISAIGSVIFFSLPARLHDARDVPAQRERAEAHTAQPELPHERARPPAQRATAPVAHFELLVPRAHLVERQLL